MGTDIYGCIEISRGHYQWQRATKLSFLRSRSYDMFSFLFGHDGRMPSQFDARGIPEDVSRQTMNRLIKKNLLRVEHHVEFKKAHPSVTVTETVHRQCEQEHRPGVYKPHEVEHFYGGWTAGERVDLPVDVIDTLAGSFYTIEERRITFEPRSHNGGHHMTYLTLEDIESVDWSVESDDKAVHVYQDGRLRSIHSLDSHSDPDVVQQLENGEKVEQKHRTLEYKPISGESLLTPDWVTLFDMMRSFRPVVETDKDIRLTVWFGS